MAYDPSLYEGRRRSYLQNYASTGAMEAYKNFLSQQRGQREIADLTRQYEEATPKFVAGYGRRNLIAPNVRSGVFARALQDFASQRVRSQSQAEEALRQQAMQYDLTQRQMQDQLQQQLADLEMEKARQIEQDAQALLQYRAGM